MRSVITVFVLSFFTSLGYANNNETFIPITTCQDLQNIQNDLSANYTVAQNIDCKGFPWKPITGDFNGSLTAKSPSSQKIYSISNLEIHFQSEEPRENWGGIFKNIKNAKISNLIIKNSTIALEKISAASSIGLIANSMQDSEIENLTLDNVSMDLKAHIYSAGLLAGVAKDSKINNVVVTNSTQKANSDSLGLLVGSFFSDKIKSEIKNSFISSSYSQMIAGCEFFHGGLTGDALGVDFISNKIEKLSLAREDINTCDVASSAGGLSGRFEATEQFSVISNKNDLSDVKINFPVQFAGATVGGLFGEINLACDRTRAMNIEENRLTTASMSGVISAGMVGTLQVFDSCHTYLSNILIQNNSIQNVVLNSLDYESIITGAGLIRGIEFESSNLVSLITIQNNFVSVKHQHPNLHGGFIATLPSSSDAICFVNNFWDKEVAQTDFTAEKSGSQGLSTEELYQPSLFLNSNWDFDNVWSMTAGSYPKLKF